jgi:hypothetical protein
VKTLVDMSYVVVTSINVYVQNKAGSIVRTFSPSSLVCVHLEKSANTLQLHAGAKKGQESFRRKLPCQCHELKVKQRSIESPKKCRIGMLSDSKRGTHHKGQCTLPSQAKHFISWLTYDLAQ